MRTAILSLLLLFLVACNAQSGFGADLGSGTDSDTDFSDAAAPGLDDILDAFAPGLDSLLGALGPALEALGPALEEILSDAPALSDPDAIASEFAKIGPAVDPFLSEVLNSAASPSVGRKLLYA